MANTPADTVDVIDPATRVRCLASTSHRSVGIDPVPGGRQGGVVSNHVSDSVSVIDADPVSPTRHQVLATIQVFDPAGRTRFDELSASRSRATRGLRGALVVHRIAIIDVRRAA